MENFVNSFNCYLITSLFLRGFLAFLYSFESYLFSDASEIQCLLKASTRMITPRSCLLAALLKQDERCLSVAVALLRLEASKM